jgi:hypothetical protein
MAREGKTSIGDLEKLVIWCEKHAFNAGSQSSSDVDETQAKVDMRGVRWLEAFLPVVPTCQPATPLRVRSGCWRSCPAVLARRGAALKDAVQAGDDGIHVVHGKT